MSVSKLQHVSKLHQYLSYLIGPDRENEKQVARRVLMAINKLQHDRGFKDRKTFLETYGIRGMYWRALCVGRSRISSVRRLAQCLRKMKMPADMLVNFDEPFAPWDAWTSGGRVAVVVGARDILLGNDESLKSSLIGTRDFQAHHHLERVLRVDAEIEFRPELKTVPDCSQAQAEEHLDRLCKETEGGAVIVLGSPLCNPLADTIARRIARMPAEELPARFRWPFSFQKSDPYLIEPSKCLPAEAGVRLRGHGTTNYARITDEHIIEEMRAHAPLKTGERLGPYADAGLLAIDYDHDPVLILCAGHGGCATIAAVLGLSQVMYIEHCLEYEHDDLGVGRLWLPVTVDRYKTTLELTDDLVFSELYGKDWRFPLEGLGMDE